jgi:hypothetical protein
MKTIIRSFLMLAVLLSPAISMALGAQDCHCRFQTGTTWPSPGTIVKDWGTIGSVSLPNRESKCSEMCKAKVHDNINSQTIANLACAAGVANGSQINGISKAGLLAGGGIDGLVGTLTNVAAQYSCPNGGSIAGTNCVAVQNATLVCPNGQWVDHGICTRNVCNPPQITGNNNGPNNAELGAGYFTWDHQLLYRGSAPTVTCPTGFTVIPGNKCQKSYAATLVSAAQCNLH